MSETEAGDGRGHRSAQAFDFDPILLADPDAEEKTRRQEWSRVYDHFDPRLRWYFLRRTTPDALDDLVQEVWRRAALRIGSLQSPRAAWTWLTTVGVNILRDQGRSRVLDNRREEAFLADFGDGLTDDDVLERLCEDPFEDVDRAAFRQRLSSLNADDRKLVQLFALEDRSHQEIAVIMRLSSPAASRQRLARIRRVLRGEQ